MTFRQLVKLVEEWRQLLLPGWRIQITRERFDTDSDSDPWAMIRARDDYQVADVWFAPELLDQDPAFIESSVVHELIHCLTRPWRAQINEVARVLSFDAGRIFQLKREHEEEEMVDTLSRAFVALKYSDHTIAVGTHVID